MKDYRVATSLCVSVRDVQYDYCNLITAIIFFTFEVQNGDSAFVDFSFLSCTILEASGADYMEHFQPRG